MIKYLSLDPDVPAHSYWDQTMLDDILEGLPDSERQIVIIPGARQAHLVDEISAELSLYPKVLAIITSDEEHNFPLDRLSHPDLIVYVEYPDMNKHQRANRYFPIGYSKIEPFPQFAQKELAWFFAGQVNHGSREELVAVLKDMPKGRLVTSRGFAQGLSRKEYFQHMQSASVIPAPGGPFSPDSFRLYEALELGAVPIADHPEFWKMMFGRVPFPTLDNWDILPGLVDNLKDRPWENNKVFAWWQQEKRKLRYHLEDDLDLPPGDITVLIPTSPIPSHPSTHIIDETIQSVRAHLPDAEIILMIDGLRKEQENRLKDYTEYTRRILWKANHEWGKVYPIVFEEHQHQANMTREALKCVRTPTILFVEHDTPITPDREIPFECMVGVIKDGDVNLIRFHYESMVHPEHKYLMLDTEPQLVDGVPLLRCAQWSQRPHLASAAFYRHILDTYFKSDQKTMIEDLIYGVLYTAFIERGTPGWNEFKVWMYAPDGDIKRSYHTDGREGDPKWAETYGIG